MSSSEGTPLLRNPAQEDTGAGGSRNFDNFGFSGTSTGGVRRNKHAAPGGRRRWGGAAVAGVFMFAVAGAGLIAIFNAIQGATNDTAQGSTALQEMLKNSDRTGGTDGDTSEHGATGRIVSLNNPSGLQIIGDSVHSQVGNADVDMDITGGQQRGGSDEAEGKAGTSNLGKGETTGAASSASVGSSTSKPNVFFIMIDDMGWNDIGYQSTDLALMTPNLDKLASEGIKMSNYYTMSICTPSRASLMTGRYPIRYGLQYNVIQPGAEWGLPLQEKLMPEYMNDAGFESHMVGKWHLGSYMHAYTPHRRGFKTYLGYLNDEEKYWTHQSWTAKLNGRKFFDFGFGNETDYYDVISRDSMSSSTSSSDASSAKLAAKSSFTSTSNSVSSTSDSGGYVGKYSTTIFTERAMEIIDSKTPFDEEPLFLYLAHQAVHDPLGLPGNDAFDDEQWAILDALHPTEPVRKKFAKVLMYLDKTIGELVAHLDKGGWLDNSIIVVASDNGGCPSTGGDNYPLRGIKHSYWDGGNKVPAFVYSRSHIPEKMWGTTYEGLIHVTDWLPTLSTAVGGTIEGSAGLLDGIDHWDYLTGASGSAENPSPRTELLYNYDPYILWSDSDSISIPGYPLVQGAFRKDNYKIMFNVWCSGYYTYDSTVEQHDILVDPNSTCQDMGTCSDCGQACLSKDVNYTDWLFDLDADPREEHNLVTIYPEIAGQLKERAIETAFSSWANSSYTDINTSAYKIWAKNGWWMVPWYHLYLEGDASDDDSTTGSTSTRSTGLSSVSSSAA